MDKALTEAKSGLPAVVGNVEKGGISGSDFEIPRVLLLQDTSPDAKNNPALKAGQYINSVTKEVLGNIFIPLFAFKQYVKFLNDGTMVWSTLNRNEERVDKGLKWGNTGDKEADKPEVTEFINFMTVWPDQPMPLVLSFKRTAFRVGKQFLTLAGMLKPQPMYQYGYQIGSELHNKGSQSWYVPKVSIPTVKKEHSIPKQKVEELAVMTAQWQPLVGRVSEAVSKDGAELEEAPF